MQEGAGELISIVDDDASIREATQRLVKANGFKAQSYSSAMEFLESGHVGDTGCLILDWRMPGMTGLELHRLLVGESRPIPTVFISGHGTSRIRAEAMEGGAIDFLLKPFSEEALLNAIHRALGLGNDKAE